MKKILLYTPEFSRIGRSRDFRGLQAWLIIVSFFCPLTVRKTTQLWVISKFSPFFDNLLEFVRKSLSRAQLKALIFVFKLFTRDITVKWLREDTFRLKNLIVNALIFLYPKRKNTSEELWHTNNRTRLWERFMRRNLERIFTTQHLWNGENWSCYSWSWIQRSKLSCKFKEIRYFWQLRTKSDWDRRKLESRHRRRGWFDTRKILKLKMMFKKFL